MTTHHLFLQRKFFHASSTFVKSQMRRRIFAFVPIIILIILGGLTDTSWGASGTFGLSGGAGIYTPLSNAISGSSIDVYITESLNRRKQWGIYSGVTYRFNAQGQLLRDYDIPIGLIFGSEIGALQFQFISGGTLNVGLLSRQFLFNVSSSIGLNLGRKWTIKVRMHFTFRQENRLLYLLMLERRIRLGSLR